MMVPCPCRVSRRGVPFPFSPLKPQVPPLPRPASSELGTFDGYFVLSTVQKDLAALSPRTKPSLNLPSLVLPAGQLRRLRLWIRAGFT